MKTSLIIAALFFARVVFAQSNTGITTATAIQYADSITKNSNLESANPVKFLGIFDPNQGGIKGIAYLSEDKKSILLVTYSDTEQQKNTKYYCIKNELVMVVSNNHTLVQFQGKIIQITGENKEGSINTIFDQHNAFLKTIQSMYLVE